MPPRRCSPRIKNQTVTEPIPATPLEFVHPGIEHTAARIETPQNPSSERNQHISRKLVLGTPLGANPQQSTSTGGENVKTIPGKGAPKTGRRGHGHGHGRGCGVPSGRGAPSGRGRGPAHLVLMLLFLVFSLMQPQWQRQGVVVVVQVLLLYLFQMPSTYTEALL